MTGKRARKVLTSGWSATRKLTSGLPVIRPQSEGSTCSFRVPSTVSQMLEYEVIEARQDGGISKKECNNSWALAQTNMHDLSSDPGLEGGEG